MMAERLMDCKQAQILLAPHILGDLDNDPLHCSQLQAHLRGCPECAEMYEVFQETIGFVLDHKAEFAQAFKKARVREEENTVSVGSPERYSSTRSLFVKISAIAACLVVGFGLFFAVTQFSKPQNNSFPVASSQQQNPVIIEVASGNVTEIIPAGQLIAASDELKTLRINNNRQMVLNTGTELSIEPYNLGCIVKLDKGEIYTEVEHDEKPFIVETTHGRAVITGTTFNIKANDEKMNLAVIEGSVRFESEEGVVDVRGGCQSSIISGTTPTKPAVCNIADVSKWAKGQGDNKAIQVNQPDVYFTKMLDSSVSFIRYRDLEKIDFEAWTNEYCEWFEREFPWTKRLQKLLSQEGAKADTIDLLIESSDLWRFAWPEYSRTQILSEDSQVIQPIATHYGIDIDHLISAKPFVQSKQISNIEAFGKWLNAFDEKRSSSIIDSIHATVFLVNTRTLAWYAVKNDKIQVRDKQQVLDLLAEEGKIALNILGELEQVLLTDKHESVCSLAQDDEYIKKIKEDISLIMDIELKLKDGT